MKRFIIILFIVSMLCSCRKEQSGTAGNVAASEINFTCGNEALTYLKSGKTNNISYYQFGGNAGNYFGLAADFTFSPSSTMQLLFGSIITSDYFLTEENVSRLLSPGRKSWGSLGAFNAHPGIQQGAVEIAYTDDDGQRWCSTIQKEYENNGRLQTKVTLPRVGYLAVDTAFVNESTHGLNPSFWVKGTVNTMLYEVNGDRQLPLAGTFCALVGIE